jgi:hypothetical protein
VSKKTKVNKVDLSLNVERRVELNQDTLCVYGFSKGRTPGMTECMNLGLSGNDEGYDQLTRKVIFPLY